VENHILSGGPAPALARGLAILDALGAAASQGLTLSELSRAIRSPKNSTSRLLDTLETAGYVTRSGSPCRFLLTTKMLLVGRLSPDPPSLVASSLDVMRQLRDQTGETVQLGIPIGDEGVIVEKVESRRPARINMDIGLRFGLHDNAPGKALLAWRAAGEREATIRRLALVRSTPRTITDPAELARECERILACGYATDRGESDEGIHCVAVPIRTQDDSLRAVLWISGFAGRMPEREFPALGGTVVAAAAAIERRLAS
jgi:DNA-binding IclR family transcriptional regulator